MKRTLIAAVLFALLAGPAFAGGLGSERKVMAILDTNQNWSNTKRAVNFYDISSITDDGAVNATLGDVFNQTPLFSVWTGFERAITQNYDDPGTITVNPHNGTVYMAAYDSGTPGDVDAGGDTEGDYDLYRMDYQEILNDWETNGYAKGVMYAPTTGPDGSPSIPHPDFGGATKFISGAIQKVGELGRTQGGDFFDYELDYVNPEVLAFLENDQGQAQEDEEITKDHELRLWKRVSKSPGSATPVDNGDGSWEGGWNRQTVESWEADTLTDLNMDFDLNGDPIGYSEPKGIAVVQDDDVTGVWVGESDGGGDDLSFFKIDTIDVNQDSSAVTITLDSLGLSRSVDEDPESDPTTNDGEMDNIHLDADGHLVIGESGYFDTVPGGESGYSGNPAGEPTFLRLNIADYQANNVDLDDDTWDDLDTTDGLGPVGSDHATDTSVAPVQLEGMLGSLVNSFGGGTGLSLDDDTVVTSGQFAVLDRAENLIYLLDNDSSTGDVYVIDLDSGEIVYEELDAAHHFYEAHGLAIFTRGDMDGDGDVDADDIDLLASTAAGSDAIAKEDFDLTGDDDLTKGAGSTDQAELVEGVLGTSFGDANLDGAVDGLDISSLVNGFGSSDSWAGGDFNGDGVVDGLDISLLVNNFGFSASAMADTSTHSTVPEPATMAVLGLGGFAALIRRRRA